MDSLAEVSFKPWTLNRSLSTLNHIGARATPDLVQNIIEDIVELLSQGKKNRQDTLFFQIVQGGNSAVIKQTLDRLKHQDLHKERAWILAENDSPNKTRTKKYHNCASAFGKFLTFVSLGLLHTLLTPIFYIYHAVALHLWRYFAASNCDDINSPLYLVCRSKSLEMIKLFQEEGLQINCIGKDGNTILHHLALHSVEDPEGAREMWDSLVQVYKDSDISELCSQTNNLGLDALEYCAMIGSLDFLGHMMDSAKVMKSVDLFVDSSTVSLNNGEGNEIAREEFPTYGLVRSKYNITKYETGSRRNFSSLLNLLCQRETSGRKSEGIEVLVQKSLLGTWIRKKTNMFLAIRMFSNLYGVVLTAVIVFYMAISGGDGNPIPLGQLNTYISLSNAAKAAQEAYNITDISTYPIYEMFGVCWQPGSYFGGFDTQSWCQLQAFETLSNQCKGQLTEREILLETGFEPKSATYAFQQLLAVVLITLMSFYLFYDLVTRLVYLWNNTMTSQLSTWKGINRTMCLKLPGSYIAKQVNVLSFSLYCAFLCTDFIFQRDVLPNIENSYKDTSLLVSTYISYFVTMFDYINIMATLTTLCLIFRMISFVFTLRLVPKLGHFIILTFKMTATLLSFLIVYFIILVAFGSLFHFLLRDPECPSIQVENFQTITESCFQTFLLMLGMAEFPDDHSAVARGTYIFYLLISAVVLLNLIIAIMSSLVEEINEQPNKAATHLMLHLEDALAAETWLSIVTGPCARRLKHWMLRRAGFCVTENVNRKSTCVGGGHSVWITLLQRP